MTTTPFSKTLQLEEGTRSIKVFAQDEHGQIGMAEKIVEVAGWTPTDLGSSLRAWYDASALSLSNDDKVASWADLSGNGVTLTHGTASQQPTFKTGVLNGKPVVRFARASGTRLFSAVNVFNPALAAPNTILLAGVTPAQAATTMFFDGRASAQRHAIYRSAATAMNMLGGGVNSYTYPFGTSAAVLRAEFNGTSSTLHRNGTALTKTQNENLTHALSGFVLGADFTGGASSDMDCGELMIIDRLLTSEEITQAEAYLMSKWGVTP